MNQIIVDAYQLAPVHVREEQVMLFTIKAQTEKQGERIMYTLYRCSDPRTPGFSRNNIIEAIPQGVRIEGTAEEIEALAKKIFPVLPASGAIPNIFNY